MPRMRDLAAAEAISPTYISRLLRLTLLSPQIVEAVLDGLHLDQFTGEMLLHPLPDDWLAQQPPSGLTDFGTTIGHESSIGNGRVGNG